MIIYVKVEKESAFIHDKIHLPPSELVLGVKHGDGACVCDLGGIRFGFLTCYDVYFNEQIEYLATQKVDVAFKYMRPVGFGSGVVRNDVFINAGLRPEIFAK